MFCTSRLWHLVVRGMRLAAAPAAAITLCADVNLNLAWDPSPDSDVVSYSIYYGQLGSSHTRIDVGNRTTATITGLQSGKTYHIYATAVNSSGRQSDPSNALTYYVKSASSSDSDSAPPPPLVTDSDSTSSPSNSPPDLQAVSGQTVAEGTRLSFRLSATDPDGNALSYSLVSGPAGAFLDAAGEFSWTPTEAQGPGSYTVTARVVDNGVPALSDSISFPITVTEVNSAPVLAAISDQTLTLSGGSGGANLLANGSFESGTLNWTATGNQSRINRSTDGAYAVVFNIGNLPPNGVLSQTFSTTAGRTYELSFDVGVWAFNYDEQRVNVTVTGGDSFAFSDTVSISGAGGGRTSWNSTSYTFVAGSSSSTLTFRDVSPTTDALDLLLDDVRVVASSSGDSPSGSLSLRLSATDPDRPSNSLSYSLVSGPTGARVDASGLFSWSPSSWQSSGSYGVTVRVTDDGVPALSDTASFKVTLTGASGSADLQSLAQKSRTHLTWTVELEAGSRLQFSRPMQAAVASGMQMYFLQASPDLRHWKTLDVVVDDGRGWNPIQDFEAGSCDIRFYRVLTSPVPGASDFHPGSPPM